MADIPGNHDRRGGATPIAARPLEAGDVHIRRIGPADLRRALRQGVDDFVATPTQLLFLGLLYPLLGFVIARAAVGADLLPLVYPLVAGIGLMGPVVAAGVYELSRRREQGLPVTRANAFDVLRNPSIRSILSLGALLLALFVAWLWTAEAVYLATLGTRPEVADGLAPGEFPGLLFGTAEGWTMIVVGNLLGLLFSAAVLTLTVVSFPMLVDRRIGSATAMGVSVRAVAANPVPMALWGMTVMALLVLGSLPLFIGLAVVVPVLGHATWHLYRAVVAG